MGANHLHPAFLSGRLVSDDVVRSFYIVNWIEVMVVRRPQIWRDESMALASPAAPCAWHLFRLRSRCMMATTEDWVWPVCLDITVYDSHCRGLGMTRLRSRCMIATTEDWVWPVCLDIWHVKYWVCGRSSWPSVSSPTAATFSSVFAHFRLPLPCSVGASWFSRFIRNNNNNNRIYITLSAGRISVQWKPECIKRF